MVGSSCYFISKTRPIINRQIMACLTHTVRRYGAESKVLWFRRMQKLKESGKLPYDDHSNGEYVLFVRKLSQVLLTSRTEENPRSKILWMVINDISSIFSDIPRDSVFLHISSEDRCRFAISLPELPEEKYSEVVNHTNGNFVDIRRSLFFLTATEAGLISQSLSLLKWKHSTKFCSHCGNKLVSDEIGMQKMCTFCKTAHYPVISPVGITLITNENHSKALLVRQPAHPPGMFTCVAGFVEVGESIEENVQREVAEEVGLDVVHITYMGSQHWALPASRLMIGCVAVVNSEQFSIDHSELEDASWFTPNQLQDALQQLKRPRELLSKPDRNLIWVPPRGAIAHDLISWWLKEYHS